MFFLISLVSRGLSFFSFSQLVLVCLPNSHPYIKIFAVTYDKVRRNAHNGEKGEWSCRGQLLSLAPSFGISNCA
jgi:hypothetical protein